MISALQDSFDALPPAERERLDKLDAFGKVLAEKRKEAVDFKALSGVEKEMEEDEEFYNSIDDANREEMMLKSATLHGTPSTVAAPAKSTKSTIFTNITQTYVDMAAASVADMLLPTDDMPFAILPTPEPDLEAATADPSVLKGPNGEQLTAGQIAQMMLKEAEESAEKAQTRIWDWLTEAHWHAEARKLINESAKVGTSVLKGPFPVKQRSKKIDRATNGQVKITMVEKLKPASKQISAKDLFPDPACGENIHDGSYVWERDKITARGLRDLKGMRDADGDPIYIDAQIERVLREGPNGRYGEDGSQKPNDKAKAENEPFQIWYFTGTATQEAMEAAGCKCQPGAAIPVVVTMVNDRVIKATLSTTDSGSFPYDVLRWQRVSGRWTGRSEARKIRTPQRILVGAVRAMMNNLGLAAGPQIIIDPESIVPADGNWEITPLKVWKKILGAAIQDVEKAIHSIKIESMQEEIMSAIKFALEMADKCATMPLQQQGQQGVTQETAEGRRLLQNNASVQKRALAKIFDDDITEPHIERYYEWLLLYGDDPSMKRDFVIDARGSTALFERDAENQVIAQVGAFVKDPAFGLNPKLWIQEFLKSNKLSPDRFKYTDREQQQIDDAAKKNPPVDPKVAGAKEVANIRAQTDMAELKSKEADAEAERAHEREMKTMDYQIKLMEYAQERGLKLDDVKASLTKVTMQLRTQKELAAGRQQQPSKGPRPAPQVAPAAVEPAGRAPSGEAFQK